MISIEWIVDNKYRIGDKEHSYCDINFYREVIEGGKLTEDDMQDLCEALRLALLNVLEDKEDDPNLHPDQ